MNLDVPLDELIKSKSNKRSGSAAAVKRGLTNKQAKSNNSRFSVKTQAGKSTTAGAASTSRSIEAGVTAGRLSNDPFSVPLDTLIASKPRSATAQGQTSGQSISSKRARSQQGARGLVARSRGRRYFSGTSASRPSAQNAESPVKRVSGKVNVKRASRRKGAYTKGLAAHVTRSRNLLLASAGGAASRNLSINRRGALSPNVSNRRRGGFMSSQQRRQQSDNSKRLGNTFGGSRSIALQTNRGRGGFQRQTSNQPTSRSMISHAIGDTLSYNTGLNGGAAAIYRQNNPSNVQLGCHVAPPVYDKTIVTGSSVPAPSLEAQEGANAVFSESDRSMFSKIKIMAQLDKITLPQGQSSSAQMTASSGQRHYINAPSGNTAIAPSRYRTLSDRFLS